LNRLTVDTQLAEACRHAAQVHVEDPRGEVLGTDGGAAGRASRLQRLSERLLRGCREPQRRRVAQRPGCRPAPATAATVGVFAGGGQPLLAASGAGAGGISARGVSAGGVSAGGVSARGISAGGISAGGISTGGGQPLHVAPPSTSRPALKGHSCSLQRADAE
jgi:hypothetical protein